MRMAFPPSTRMCLLYTFQPERQPTSQRNESFEMSFKAAIHVNHVCRNSYCILFMAYMSKLAILLDVFAQ